MLFADVKGSMDLAEHDPEEWHKVMDRFFAILSDGVHRFEGTINQYTGDGIMALFGAPIAHEDHARRACYAALHLRDELRRYADDLRRKSALNFSVRMGMNSGEVVVGARRGVSRFAEDLQDSAFLSSAHHNAGEACFWTGEFVRAQAHLEQAIALYDPKQHRSRAWVGMDLWILSSGQLAWNEQLVGRSDQALRRSLATVARAPAEPSRLYELALAQSAAAGIRQLRREEDLSRDRRTRLYLCAPSKALPRRVRWVSGRASSRCWTRPPRRRALQEIVGGSHLCGRFVRHRIVVGRSLRE